MNNFLLLIAAILVLVLTALFAVPPMINWNDFRGAFEEEASRLLDREVRVRGEVSVRILPVPYVSFEKVRIADAPNVPGSFARAEKFKMWLSVPPLLRGILEARQIELERPVIRLRTEADGSGNWRKLQISKRNLAYIPNDVALKSVLITEGTLLFESHHGHEIARLNKITGEMTATALTGPYKFIGAMPLGNAPEDVAQEIRFSTARMEENGDVRFSGSVRSPDGTTVHTMNGTLSDLLGSAGANGRVTSRSRPARRPKDQGAGYELTADLKIDAEALRLNNIAITFRNNERQQSLNGTAVTSWREGVVTQTNLTASWLDLDAISGAKTEDGPLNAVERLVTRGIAPFGVGLTTLDLSIDQANLAGTAISDLKGRMVRRDAVTKIEAMRASLPGLSALAIDGFLEHRENGLQFDGNVLLRSASLTELAQWGRIKLNKRSARGLATSFSLNGNIRVRAKSWELSDALVRLADATAEGAISYDWSGRPSLVATIDADRLALEKFGENLLTPALVATYLGLSAAGSDASAATTWQRDTDIMLSLRSGHISDGSSTFKDVDVNFKRTADVVDLKKFNLTWQPGLKLALTGKLAPPAKQSAGKLTGLVTVSNDAAGARLAELLNLASTTKISSRWMAGLTPLRVAVDASLGVTGGTAAAAGQTINHLVADGTLGDDRIRIDARTFGHVSNWYRQTAEIQTRLSGRDAHTTTQWLLGKPLGAPVIAAELRAAASKAPQPATIVMTAAGTPEKTMKTYLHVAAGKVLDADFSGDFGFAAGKPSWSGHIDIRQTTAKNLAHLIWPSLRDHVANAPMRGRIMVRNTANGYHFEPQPLHIGTTRLTGKLDLLAARAELPRLSGTVALSDASLPRLAGLLMRAAPARRQRNVAQPGVDDAAWPDTPFDFAHLGAIDAGLDVKVKSLALTALGSHLSDAVFRVALTPSQVTISNFSARSGGATFKGNVEFEKSQAGVSVSAKITGSNIALRQWAPELARTNRLSGTADIDVTVAGKALSPRSLSSALDGKGVIRLSDVRVPGVTTETVTAVARKVIEGELLTDALGVQIKQLATEGSVDLGAPVLNVRIANGTLALPAVIFEQDAGGLRNQTFIDLPRLRIDSQWTVTPEPQPRPDRPGEMVALPPVTIVYAGTIAEIGRIDAKINLGDLERELIVRQMESNVARLERLRREDETRAAAEAERQRKIEKERRRSIEIEKLRRLKSTQPTAINPQLPPGARIDRAAPSVVSPQGAALLPPSSTVPAGPTAGGAQQSAVDLRENPAPTAAAPPPRRSRVKRRRPVEEKFDPFNID